MIRLLVCLVFFSQLAISFEREEFTLTLEQQSYLVTKWSNSKQKFQFPVILLSGPNDNWNSDGAWFASLAPTLVDDFDVYLIERPGIGLAQENAELGYRAFAKYVNHALTELNLEQVNVVGIASSNITMLHFFHQYSPNLINKLVLVDPDVLTSFSIERYSKDAKPFKDNEASYVEYLSAGKYTERVEQKNETERGHLIPLIQGEQRFDSDYFKLVLARRLEIANQVNLFKEIALYEQDLRSAFLLNYPKSLNLTIIDTDFEQAYIDAQESETEIEGLKKWRSDAKGHYFSLVQDSNKRLILVNDQEHLYPFKNPEHIKQILMQ